jgi:hypothetical protein
VTCIVKNCDNQEGEGTFVGNICMPCHIFIAEGRGVHSQIYRNGLVAAVYAIRHAITKYQLPYDDREIIVP